jgi:hypothetical protein
MECNKWEEAGLLFTAGELHEHTAAAFKEHCKECAFCAQQVEQYLLDKARLFTKEILCACPSLRVDQAVAQACAHPMRVTSAHWSLFAGVKKAALPLLLFILGFGAGTYFVLNIQNARSNAPVAAAPKTLSVPAIDSLDTLKAPKLARNDSGVKPIDRPFRSPSGNPADQILPVKE